MTNEEDIRAAAYRIARKEKEAEAIFTPDMMAAALNLHFKDWDKDRIEGVVKSLNMTWGCGAFYMARERRDA